MPAANISPEIRLFIEDMLQESKLNFESTQTKETVISGIFRKLDEYLGVAIEENLSDDDLVIYYQLIQSDKESATIKSFLRNTLPNFDEIMTKAMLDFREVYVTSIRS